MEPVLNIKSEFDCGSQFSPLNRQAHCLSSSNDIKDILKNESSYSLKEDLTRMKVEPNMEETRLYNISFYECKQETSLLMNEYEPEYDEHDPLDITTSNTRYKNKKKSNVHKHKCDICDYSCTLKTDLQKHTRIHSGDKPYHCDICSYKCAVKGSLQMHMRTHSGEMPFQCEVCDYKCTQSSNLQRHMRTHTGEKPYGCEICSYRCTLNCDLQKHMRTHTGEKPYQCKLCGYKSIWKGNLKKHMPKHTGEKPYECLMCGYKCGRKGNLQRHIMLMHKRLKPQKCG